jgi:hypothetical protein
MNYKEIWFKQIEERLTKATPGPWKYISSKKIPYENRIVNFEQTFVCKGGKDVSPWDLSDANADFIANARTDIEFLLKELKVASSK